MAILLVALGASVARAQDPQPNGWVVLSLDEYRALRARAFPVPPTPTPPPVDAALTRVDYDLRANGDTVSGEARLTVDVLKQGWVSIQAPAGVLVRGARLNGRPTALVAGSPPRVLIANAGRATLTLDIVVPIAASGGTESMTLPASASAVSSVRRPYRGPASSSPAAVGSSPSKSRPHARRDGASMGRRGARCLFMETQDRGQAHDDAAANGGAADVAHRSW